MLQILFFFRKRKGSEMTADFVSNELRSSSVAVETNAKLLVGRGFLKLGQAANSFQYVSLEGHAEVLVEKLEKLYSNYQVRVIEQIYSPKKTAVQDLADAFKIRTGGKDG